MQFISLSELILSAIQHIQALTFLMRRLRSETVSLLSNFERLIFSNAHFWHLTDYRIKSPTRRAYYLTGQVSLTQEDKNRTLRRTLVYFAG